MCRAILKVLLLSGLALCQGTANTIRQPVTTPATTSSSSPIVRTPGPPHIPPIVTQCFFESKWYPAGAVINAGRHGNLCFGAYCDLDGFTKHWSNHDCPKPDPSHPEPPFPEFPTPQTITARPVTKPPYTFQGCFHGERYYFPGEYMELGRQGGVCNGLYCDFESRLQAWVDFCRDAVLPFPVDIT